MPEPLTRSQNAPPHGFIPAPRGSRVVRYSGSRTRLFIEYRQVRTVRLRERKAVHLHAASKSAGTRLAGSAFAALFLMVAIGWWLAPGDRYAAAPLEPPTDTPRFEFTATAVSTGGITTITAMILGFLIVGAAAIGLIFYPPAREIPQRPRRSRAAVGSGITPRAHPVRSWRPSSGTRGWSWSSSAGRSADRWPGASPDRTALGAACG